MRTMARAARSNARIWWPELLWIGFAAPICLTTRTDGPVGLVILLAVSGVFWAMGFRHRHRPVFEVIRRMDAKLDAALAQDGEARPRFTVHRGGKAHT